MATKKEVLNALATVNFEDITVGDVTVTADDIKDFVETSLTQLENRAAKAAERAAQRKTEGDAVRAAIKDVIGEDPMTIAEIIEAVGDPDLTPAKAIARLTQLCKLGEIFKADTKKDGRSLKVYSTVPFSTEE